jgi:hypothetical protein
MAATDCGGALVACSIEHCRTLAVHDSWALKPRVSARLESAEVSKLDS